MRFADDRPERSLSDAILGAIGSLTVLYFAGLLFKHYVSPETLWSFLELLRQIPPVLFIIVWVVLIYLS